MLIKNAELRYARLEPNRPNKKFNKDNPTWEVQIVTYSSAQKKEWEAQGLSLKAVVPDDDSADSRPYWKTTLKKKIKKRDGSDSSPVEVKNGDLSAADPAVIGNGSIGNVQVFQYEYTDNNGKKGIANVLMGVHLRKLVKYVPKPRDDDFEAMDMEVVDAEENEEEDVDGGDDEAEEKPKAPSPKPKSKFD